MSEKWSLNGHYVMGCNCDYGCPCNFNARPSAGHCEGIMGFVIDKGNYGDVDVSGTAALAMVWWPGAIHEGYGRSIIFVDESAGKDKAEALGKTIAGEAGGPLGIFRSTWAEQFTTKEFAFESGDMKVSFPGKTAQVAKIAWSG